MRKLLLFFCLLSLTASGQIRQSVQQRQFNKRNFTITFPTGTTLTLPQSAVTSAGIFKREVLVRTLWSNRRLPAGPVDFATAWDGFDDDGNATPDTAYSVRLLYGNPSYTWEGVLANSSDSLSGPNVWHPGEGVIDVAVAGNRAAVAPGYNEGKGSNMVFSLSNPHIAIETTTQSGGYAYIVRSDSTLNYWAEATLPGQFIVAANRVANDAFTAFPGSTSFATGQGHVTYPGALIMGTSPITGLAVQRPGNYVYIAQGGLNRVSVYNKTSGAVTQQTLANAGLLATAPGKLFVAVSSTAVVTAITAYAVGTDGVVGSSLYTISGIGSVSAINTNRTGTELAVVDAVRGQVRFFNTADGIEKTPLGQLGGYASTPRVYNDKFSFREQRRAPFGQFSYGALHPFVSYGDDGSIWVGDNGNLRVQHFAANLSYIESIYMLGYNYSVTADPTNPTRVFAAYLEYERDYSKPLGPRNGSWTLKYNWGEKVNKDYDSGFTRIISIKTFSNGRSYYMGRKEPSPETRLIELDTTSGLRYTNTVWNNHTTSILPDGSVLATGTNALGVAATVTRYPLTGYNASNDPQYGAGVVIATTPIVTGGDPVTASGRNDCTGIAADGTIITFSRDNINYSGGVNRNGENYGGRVVRAYGYHLGGLTPGVPGWKFRTSQATQRQNQSQFPDDGGYDLGNSVNYSGSRMLVRDNVILWGYQGENWKSNQTNMWNVFHPSGLMVGQFGVLGPIASVREGISPRGMGGNVVTSELVKVGNDYYLYHCDEGYHAGIHSWKLTGLNDVQVVSLPVQKTAITKTPILPYVDLMVGLPRSDTTKNGARGDTLRNGQVSGWATSPAAYRIYKSKPDGNGFLLDSVRFTPLVQRYTYKKGENDVSFIWFPAEKGTSVNVTRSLPVSSSVSSWTVSGQMAFPNSGEPGSTAVEILDNTGKIICRINKTEAFPNTPVSANTTQLFSTLTSGPYLATVMRYLQPFSFSRSGSQILVRYAEYAATVNVFDAGADVSRPTTLRLLGANTPDRNGSHMLVIANPRIYLP